MKFLSLAIFLMSSVLAFGGQCRIQKIVWSGEHSDFDETEMQSAVGAPCDGWRSAAQKLERYYENRGFLGAVVEGSVDSAGELTVQLNRGAAWVWAPAENLEAGKTKPEAFAKLAGLEAGAYVSPTDLERADRKLSRLGYYERTAPAQMFRDPTRNRIVPVFHMRAAAVSEAEALLTYSSEGNAWEGQINVNLYNILGTARDLQLEGFIGDDSRHLEGSYKEPWIFGTSWNVVARGMFNEETVTASDADSENSNEDSTSAESIERTLYGEIGVTRDIGFDFNIGVFVGVSEDNKYSSLEVSYVSLDRFALPRDGWRIDGKLSYKMDRPDSLDNFLLANASVMRYQPIYKNFIGRISGVAGGIFPSDGNLKRTDLFALGGMDSFKGMGYQAVRTRAFGFGELALLWQDSYDLSIELFYQPGLYRRSGAEHGWAREQDYGIAFTQYRKNWSINLYYAMRNGCNFLDGVIGFGVKTLF
ncbi:MAG: BamA/TamA family outer membrane protein [Fibrobacter sp.]|nr:BamA/TamA family outer membrane protein [Fibrobacter sp.]